MCAPPATRRASRLQLVPMRTWTLRTGLAQSGGVQPAACNRPMSDVGAGGMSAGEVNARGMVAGLVGWR